MKNKLLLLIGCCLTLLTISSTKIYAAEKTVKIGILQLINQSALDDARKGFLEELSKEGYDNTKIKIDYLNAQGDQSNLKSMAEKLKKDKNNINLALATPAAQILHKVDNKTPLLFTAISDSKAANLTTSLNHPNQNATGTTDLVNINTQINYLLSISPKIKTVGIIYNSSELNSSIQVKKAASILNKKHIKVKKSTVTSTNDVSQVTRTVAKKVDAIYLPTDNIMAAAMPTVGKIATELKIPVIPGASTMVKDGGLATKGVNYKNLGRQTAKQAIKILEGKKVSSVAIEKPKNIKTIINKSMAKKINIPLSKLEK